MPQIDIETVYSSSFDDWYNDYKLDREKWAEKLGAVTRLVIVGGQYCDPPCPEVPVFEGPVKLVAEPDNAMDPNAILIFYQDLPVGYLVRERCFLIRSEAWRQTPNWKELPMLVNSRYGLYAVGV